jgi:predicted DsbA family dithiol-disulfide isomerase
MHVEIWSDVVCPWCYVGARRFSAALDRFDPATAAGALASGSGADRVRAEEARATELGIGAVPTFVIEGRWAIPGAQDVDTFIQVLQRAAERIVPLATEE